MANRDLVVIGGSAGATQPLKEILRALPADLPAAVVVVLHVPATSVGIFATVAAAASTLPVSHAEDGALLERGRVHLAPANRHLLVIDGRLKLGTGPRENLARPAIDPLFRSAALSAGARAIGVILSGKLNDGASGLAAIKERGGIALVQAPQEASERDMPLAALETTPVDLSAKASDIASAILGYTRGQPSAERPASRELRLEVEIAAGSRIGLTDLPDLAKPVAITCPDCGGVLSEIEAGHPLRFRCQVGHAYTGQALMRRQEGRVDEAMRVALRIIEERAELVSRMKDDATKAGRSGMALMYDERAREYREYAESLREAVLARLDIVNGHPEDMEGSAPAAEVFGPSEDSGV
jgi:two-component system chemotaxis response regulator CheB